MATYPASPRRRSRRVPPARHPRRSGPVPAIGAVILALAGCAGTVDPAERAGARVWSATAGRFVDVQAVTDAVRAADVLLLGETHTIAAHHRLQARLIGVAATQGRPAIVFEMIHRDQQGAIEQWRADGADPAAFGAAVAWEQRGWPDWSMYQPIVEAAVAHDLPVYGAAPPREILRRVGHEGLEALEPQRRRELGLERPLPAAGDQRLRAALRAVHCNVDEDAMLEAMLRVQRLRDAYLAEQLRVAAGEHGGAVLIAGRGHTRADHGVPIYLRGHLPPERILSIGFAGTGEFAGIEALRRGQGGALGHEYVWLTRGGEPAPGCDGNGTQD